MRIQKRLPALLLLPGLLSGCGGSLSALPSPEEAQPPEPPALSKDGSYASPEDVAEYLVLYEHLPDNFITKNQARDLGWGSSRGSLWDVAPGMSVGGDRFGNCEGLLPNADGRW